MYQTKNMVSVAKRHYFTGHELFSMFGVTKQNCFNYLAIQIQDLKQLHKYREQGLPVHISKNLRTILY